MSMQTIVLRRDSGQPGASLRRWRRGVFLGVIATTPLLGCEDNEIRAYRAPKAAPPPQQMTPELPPATMTDQAVVWTLPDGWEEVPTEQAMRLATFTAGEGMPEITLSAFPGTVGGVLANINRWRGQIGLEPTDNNGLMQSVISIPESQTDALVVDLRGPDEVRMLASIITPGDGQSWFVKSTGGSASIDSLVAPFIEFSKSVRLGDSAAVDPHAGHNHPPGEHPVDHSTVDGRIASWSMPANWKPEQGASPILSASYLATNEADGARITVTRLSGDGGGDLANINRWRNQLGLAPMETLNADAGVISESPMTVDLVAPDQSSRMLAAIVAGHGQTYYFKMTGSVEGCEAELAGFDRLVREVGGDSR